MGIEGRAGGGGSAATGGCWYKSISLLVKLSELLLLPKKTQRHRVEAAPAQIAARWSSYSSRIPRTQPLRS